MKSETAITVAKTVQVLQANGINADLHNIDSAEIVTARDMFANVVLHSTKWDALLFIDADMGFDPRLILKMLQQGIDVTAAACPRRQIDLARFVSAAQAHGDLRKAASQASNFTVFFDWENRVRKPSRIESGFCTAVAAGMAIAMITKSALEQMVEAKVVEPRLDLNASGGATCWSFFGILEPDGRRLGEDYSFCYRWTKMMGRELRVCVDEEIVHVGDFDYRGAYIDNL
jgi:hypothetical protein